MAASNESARVHIDVFSDVVCPWCYIGKHRLERALTLTPHTAAEVEYRPYFLSRARASTARPISKPNSVRWRATTRSPSASPRPLPPKG